MCALTAFHFHPTSPPACLLLNITFSKQRPYHDLSGLVTRRLDDNKLLKVCRTGAESLLLEPKVKKTNYSFSLPV